MTCEQDSAGWPSLQTIPAGAIPLAASPRPSRAGGGLSLASLIIIPAKASDPASPFPTKSWPDLIRRVFFPSPLWGGMSERSKDRVGSLRRLRPTPRPSPQGGGEYFPLDSIPIV